MGSKENDLGEFPKCWCGNTALIGFSEDYFRCPACETLISVHFPDEDIALVDDDDRDFYGREYWFSHQEEDLGYGNIISRARTDLPERCLYWLRTLLKYQVPPGRALEVGCAHGGFVAMLRWAGFDSVGLELSPWVVDFAKKTFGIPVLLGPLEKQNLDAGSFDVIALMDVLEHLRDPSGTLRCCFHLLKPEGVLIIQTPEFVEGMVYDDLRKQGGPFLQQLTKAREHLYLFSRKSIGCLLSELGFKHVRFEPPFFAHYDMFLVAGRERLETVGEEAVQERLLQNESGRMVQALIDLDGQVRSTAEGFKRVEKDSSVRLDQIHELTRLLRESEEDRNARMEQVHELARLLGESEEDRNARMEQVHELARLLGESEEARKTSLAQVGELTQVLQQCEEDLAVLKDSWGIARVILASFTKSPIYRFMCATGLWRETDEHLQHLLGSR